jgi:hypothetical protein
MHNWSCALPAKIMSERDARGPENMTRRAAPQGEVVSALTDRRLVALLSELLGGD